MSQHIFVEGIPLTSAGSLSYMTARPGERRLNPFSMHLGFKNNQLRFASGAFSASLIPAEFQFIVNIIDYKFSARDTVSSPRFGSMAWDFSTGKNIEAYWIDPRISKSIVKNLNDKGLHFTKEGYFDTGLGAVAIIKNDGFLEGAIAPMTSIGQSAGRIDP